MAFENGSTLNVIYDDKILGNTIDPIEWNDNFKEIENKDNANVGKFNANFAKLTANTGSAEIGSPAIAGLGETVDSTVYTQLLLATTAILDRYTKAEIDTKTATDADKYIANVTLNASKDLVITWGDGDSQTIALDLEKIPASFGFDVTGTKLVITNQDGTKYETDVSSLLNLYTFNDSSTIDFTTNDYNITATINAGSITDTMLHSDLITQLQSYVTSASASATTATSAKDSAIIAKDGASASAYDALMARNGASTFATNASNSATTATNKADEATTSANNAHTSEVNSEAFATNSKSWAIGTTGTRAGEDTDNAKYYAQIAHDIANIDSIGDAIVASLTKDTVVDTDIFGFVDSEASNTLKKTAWSNIKSKLKTYFDTLYALGTEVFKKDGSVQMTGVLKTVGGGTSAIPANQLQMGKCSIMTDNEHANISLVTNAYFDGANWRYTSDGVAGVVNINSSNLNKPVNAYYAISGLKDAVITWLENTPLTPTTGLPLTGGTLTGNLNISNPFANIEMGSGYETGTPYIDFHSSGTPNDYDVRIIADGGTSTDGQGSLSFFCGNAYVNGGYKIYGEHNITVSTSAPSSALAEGCQHQVY